MHIMMKMRWMSVAVSLLAGLMMVSCLGPTIEPGGEVTELAGLKVLESQMTTEVDGDQLAFTMLLQRTKDKNFSGTLKAELVDLEGNSYDQAQIPFELSEQEKIFHFSLKGLPEEEAGLENLAKYLVAYRVEWDNKMLYGSPHG